MEAFKIPGKVKLGLILLVLAFFVAHCNGVSHEFKDRLKATSFFKPAHGHPIKKRGIPAKDGIFDELGLKGFGKDKEFVQDNIVETSHLDNNEFPSINQQPVYEQDNDHKEVEHPELKSHKVVWNQQKVTNEQINQKTMFQGDLAQPNFDEELGPTLFTVANTDTDRPWEQIPYREKYQWAVMEAPCHEFLLAVPDERDAHGEISICIYRRNLEYTEKSAMIIHQEEKHVDTHEQREMKVYGHVVDHPGSDVYGRLVERLKVNFKKKFPAKVPMPSTSSFDLKLYFYGEVSMLDSVTHQPLVYVVEEINLLSSLMHHSEKLIHNLMVVMNKGVVSVSSGKTKDKKTNSGITPAPPPTEKRFNAVVTIGVSLLTFVSTSFNPNQFKPMPFVVLSTGHNSYITSGEPSMQIDDNGRVKLTSPGDSITIDIDGSVLLKTKSKEYTFRPNGKTILREGLKVTTLQEHEGPVALTAVTSSVNYGCIIPSPSFSESRKGGFLCKVCLAADKIFHEKYKSTDNYSTSVFLGHTIDKVSWIFRSVDWDNDQKFDNIGLDYDLQTFNWKYTDDEREDTSPEELEVLFNTLTSMDFSDCCLGVAFTMKKFPPNIFAKSSASKPLTPAGICAVRTEEVSNNVILISGNDKTGGFSAITPDQLVYLTAHEIAKAFGATPDTTGETNCDSFTDPNGMARHFLLWPDVLRETILDEKHFSPCSQQSIQKSLATCKSSCFDLDQHPFCGNGIVEEGEECDCGSEQACREQFCCFGRSGKYPCHKTGVPCKKENGGSLPSAAVTLVLGLLAMLIARAQF